MSGLQRQHKPNHRAPGSPAQVAHPPIQHHLMKALQQGKVAQHPSQQALAQQLNAQQLNHIQPKEASAGIGQAQGPDSLKAWEQTVQAGLTTPAKEVGGRSETALLAAIKAKATPRYVARVGSLAQFSGGPNPDFKESFTRFFGPYSSGSSFATEPSELVGCTALEAALKTNVGLKDLILLVGQPIAMCILDTQADTQTSGKSGVDVNTQDFTWETLRTAVLANTTFKAKWCELAKAPANSEHRLLRALSFLEQNGFESAKALQDPTLKPELRALMTLLGVHYNIDSTFRGDGVQRLSNQGASSRQLLVSSGGNFRLTEKNHTVVQLGTFTREDLKKAFPDKPL